MSTCAIEQPKRIRDDTKMNKLLRLKCFSDLWLAVGDLDDVPTSNVFKLPSEHSVVNVSVL